MGTIPRPKGFPIEGKKHMKELKNKFDMGFNKINHKIDMKVKKLSSHHQSFNTIHVRIQTSYIPGGGVCFRLGSGRQERIKLSVRVLSLGGIENGGRCLSTVIENRNGGRKRRRNDFFYPIQYCPLLQKRFQTVEIDLRDDTRSRVPFERGRVVVTLHCRKRK